jgi:hypothetical protein
VKSPPFTAPRPELPAPIPVVPDTESSAALAREAAEPERPEPVARALFQLPLPGPERLGRAPATRYANLTEQQCREELKRLGLPVERVRRPTPGVATPVRIVGKFHGVQFSAPGGKTPYGVLDCRMALAINDFAALLVRFDVVKVRIDNIYRRGAHLPRSRKRSQHAYGLALDITEFELSSGIRLKVAADFDGRIGAVTCGPESLPRSGNAATLSNIVCAVARAGIFHDLLTPNYNAAHRSHFHFDIKRKSRAISVR